MRKLFKGVQYQVTQYLIPLLIFTVIGVGYTFAISIGYVNLYKVGEIDSIMINIFGNISFNLLPVAFVLVAVIISITYKGMVKNLNQNGFSRQEIFLSRIIAIVMLGLAIIPIVLLMSEVQRLIYNSVLVDKNSFMNNLFYSIVVGLMCMIPGVLFNLFMIIFNRIGVIKSIIIYFILGFLFNLLNTFRNAFLTLDQQEWIMSNIFSFIPQGELPMSYIYIPMTIVVLISTVGGYFLFMKTEITE